MEIEEKYIWPPKDNKFSNAVFSDPRMSCQLPCWEFNHHHENELHDCGFYHLEQWKDLF